ncbi:hypothetical protein RQM59_08905 [Flavobacteriaceae bacterium S356]|uniref:Secreted protein n=1 Tax=Asprobacillus argus TaxID=3076534 RepID=A0ABU3LHG0_9FLAO|nr:hypothetical protein [Flavobacteriaceae bacterium S356]
MKQVYLKIQAIFLALMILVVSNSYAITSHFCGSTLVDVSYFGKSSACGMMPAEDDCEDEQTIKKDCCKDVVEIIEPEVLDKTITFKFNTKEFAAVVYFAVSYINSFEERIIINKILSEPPPPDVDDDIQVLHQTFLI